MNRITNRVGAEAGAERLAATHLMPPPLHSTPHLDLRQPP
jgi:hypothetical protein